MANLALAAPESSNDFWSKDEWNMWECPSVEVPEYSQWTLQFKCKTPSINSELKYACRRLLEDGHWQPTNSSLPSRISKIINWLNSIRVKSSSIAHETLPTWEKSLAKYLQNSQKRKRYLNRVSIRTLMVFRKIYEIISEGRGDLTEYDKDVWDLRNVGVAVDRIHSTYKLNFTPIQQDWLRDAAKAYLRYCLQVQPCSSCHKALGSIRAFSNFLKTQSVLKASEIDRPLIVTYLAYLSSRKYSSSSRRVHLSFLRAFFLYCSREQLEGFPEHALIFDEDFPVAPKALPRFIPESVLEQLNAHIDEVPIHVRRMLLILQECGMRIGELLMLPLSCIEQDHEGDWFIRFHQSKVNQDHTQPISKDAAAIIQAQQKDVIEKWGEDTLLLFPNPKGGVYTARNISFALKRFTEEKKIRDSSGQLWNFTLHQFRHTFATRLINNGMSGYEVQLMMGHKSPEMTNRYARIHHTTLKKKYQEYLGNRKLVDLSGKVFTATNPAEEAELQILKKSLHAQSLPNGYCSYPVVLGPCPHSNACLTCRHFRTDQTFVPILRRQLDDTRNLIEQAEKQGWKRVVEMNKAVEENLSRILPILEDNNEA